MRYSRRALWGLIGSLGTLAGIVGCGGDDSNAPPPVAEPPPPVAVQPVAPPVVPPPPPAPPPEPEQPKRPDDIALWQADDFRSARTERDPRLKEAIVALGQRSAGDAGVVALLVELLEPEKPSGEAAGAAPVVRFGGNPGTRPPEAAVVAALIGALGRNATADADRVLERLLSHDLDPGVAARNIGDGVLDALNENPSGPHQDLLLAAALTPEKYCPPTADNPQPGLTNKGSQLTASQLRREAIARLKDSADAELRTKLAERLGAASLVDDDAKPFYALLLEPRAENVPAQLVLYQQPQLDPLLRLQLVQLIGQLAMASLDQLLGIPSNLQIKPPAGYKPGNFSAAANRSRYRIGDPIFPRGFDANAGARARQEAERLNAANPVASTTKPAAATQADAATQLARLLWNKEFVDALLKPAEGVDSIEKVLPLSLIAASIPLHESRSTLARLNKGLWDEGTKELQLGGMFGTPFHDPGLLVVVKDVPRKEDPAHVETRSGSSEQRRSNSRSRAKSTPPKSNSKDIPKYEWMQAAEEMVYVWNARFHAAAQSQKSLAGGATPADEPAAVAPAVAATETPPPDDAAAKPPAADTTSPAAPDRRADDAFGTATPVASDESSQLPVELHDEATVVAEYRLEWPADLQGKLSGVEVSPLIVHYVRIEEMNRGNKVLAHYQKELKGAKTRTIDRGRWLDLVDDGSAAGRRRSVDVMIRSIAPPTAPAAGKDAKPPKNPEESLVIEILSIEIPDPQPEPDTTVEKDPPTETPRASAGKAGADAG